MESHSISELYKVISRDSGGSQNKYHMDGIWFKQDTAGEESMAESMVSFVLEHSNVNAYISYKCCYVNGKRSCKAADFLGENESFISLYKLYMTVYHRVLSDDVFRMDNAEQRFHFLVTVFQVITGIDLTTYLSNIIALDLLCLNPDRHFKNLGVIYDGQGYREAPIFDNGQALGANWSICPPFLSVEECINNIHSCTIAGSFEIQFTAIRSTFKIDYDSLMTDLFNIHTQSRVIEILKYQLKRYKGLFAIGDKEKFD